MNNTVYYDGKCVGYRCFTCGDIRQSMWGTKCNVCRAKSDDADKLRVEIRRLTESLEQLKNKP